VDERQYKLVES